MSSATTSPVVTDTKKTRAPTLSEKYSKFIQFGYYMMSQMQDTDSFTKEEFLNKVEMFATVDEQQTFIQGFLDNQKENKKSMRKDIEVSGWSRKWQFSLTLCSDMSLHRWVVQKSLKTPLRNTKMAPNINL